MNAYNPTQDQLFRTPTAEAPTMVNGTALGEFDIQYETSSSPLAAYVLGELPRDLQAIREGQLTYDELSDKHRQVLTAHAENIAGNTDPTTAAVTQLDLGFMLSSYLPDTGPDPEVPLDPFRKVPPELQALLQQQANRFGLPDRLDYELIIDINSGELVRTGQMRTFLSGPAGESERDFYYGHYVAEVYVKAAAFGVQELVDNPTSVDANLTLALAAQNMITFVEYMRAYMHLSIDHFTAMRPYLANYPDGKRNASGAFMPGVQLLELAVNTPSPGFEVFLAESAPYFPRWARQEMLTRQASATAGQNLSELVRTGAVTLDDDARASFNRLLEAATLFKLAHTSAAHKQLKSIEGMFTADRPVSRPQIMAYGERDVLEPGGQGTAGFHVQNLFAAGTYRYLKLQQEFGGPSSNGSGPNHKASTE